MSVNPYRSHTNPGQSTKPRLVGAPRFPGTVPRNPNIVDVGTLLARTRVDTINRTAPDPTPLTVAGINSLLPVVYGRWRLGSKLTAFAMWNGNLYMRMAWCLGEIDAIEEIRVNDDLVFNATGVAGNGVITTSYMGTPTQGVDPTLAQVYLFLGKTYTDTLPNVAYTVMVIPPGVLAGFPRCVAKVRGMKVRFTQAGTPTWSDNPAYALADFIESDRYGPNATANWTDVATVAADCDTLIGSPSEKKRLLNISLDSSQPCETWINVLRDYAGCFAIPEGGVYYLPLDAATAVQKTFDSTNIVADSMQVSKVGALDQPTVVEVTYTDTSNVVWRTNTYTEYRPGVLAGTIPRRMSRVTVTGITRYSQAVRYARERLNEATTSDLVIRFRAFDDGITLRAGEIIAVNHPIGFGPVTGYATGKPFRLAKVEPDEPGRWTITAKEFDPGKYSNDVVLGPILVDTVIPTPNNPPAVTGLTVVEDVYQVQTGYYGSRLALSWTAVAWPFVAGYEVTVLQGANVKEGPVVVSSGTSYVTKQLTENQLYNVQVAVKSITGQTGTPQTFSITNSGKLAKPSDVPSVTGLEVGGEVRLQWSPATDLDLTAHEIRYSAVGGSWASATLINRVPTPSVAYQTKVVPPGLWRFWIKGLDSVRSTAYPFGQESLNAASVDITVTSDANAFVATKQDFATPLLFNMVALASGGWATSFGDTWSSLFPLAMSTYTNQLVTYHAAGTSGLITSMIDVGTSITGDWNIGPSYTDVAGTATVKLQLNNTGGESAKTITGATNANPIVITSTAHGYNDNDEILIAGVLGNTNANGWRRVKVVTTGTYSLQDLFGNNIAGNGTYTSGGTSSRWVWSTTATQSARATARYVRMRLETTGTVQVSSLGSMSLNVVARGEGGTTATLASSAVIVHFANLYTKAVSATVDVQATAAFTGTYDQIETGSPGIVGALVSRPSDVNAIPSGRYTVTSWTMPSTMTVEAMVQINRTDSFAVLFSFPNDTGTTDAQIVLDPAPNGLTVRYQTAGGTAVNNFFALSGVNATTPAVGRWVRVSVVFSGTTASLYYDGALQGTCTCLSPANTSSARTWVVGGNNGTGNFWPGKFYDFRVWNIALSATTLLANRSVRVDPASSGLVAYWKFDGNGTDATTNARNLTAAGTVTYRPLNGMDIYAFNSTTGAQVALPVSWAFQGV